MLIFPEKTPPPPIRRAFHGHPHTPPRIPRPACGIPSVVVVKFYAILSCDVRCWALDDPSSVLWLEQSVPDRRGDNLSPFPYMKLHSCEFVPFVVHKLFRSRPRNTRKGTNEELGARNSFRIFGRSRADGTFNLPRSRGLRPRVGFLCPRVHILYTRVHRLFAPVYILYARVHPLSAPVYILYTRVHSLSAPVYIL